MVDNQSELQKTAGGRGEPTSSARIWVAYAVRHLWQGIREWCGDSAYERYLSAQRLMPGERAELTREEFYVEQLNRRYSRPNRCC
jgi:uncharacterized short protein YbdD (DUF466 family)